MLKIDNIRTLHGHQVNGDDGNDHTFYILPENPVFAARAGFLAGFFAAAFFGAAFFFAGAGFFFATGFFFAFAFAFAIRRAYCSVPFSIT